VSGAGGGGSVLWDLDARGVGTVTLNRPEVNNAYNGDLIQRFDGKILEIVSSNPIQAETWEWLYQQCKALNTGKDDNQLFRSQD